MSKNNTVRIEAGNLGDRFVLRRMKTGLPSGWYTIKEAGLTVAEAHQIHDAKRAKSSINIFATPELEATKKHAKRCRNFFDLNSAWGDNWRMFSKARLDEQYAWEDKVKEENLLLYRRAIASVRDRKERDRIELSEGGHSSLYNPDLYPDEDAMMERYTFTFEANVIPSPANDVRVGASREQVERFRLELTEQHNRQARDAHNTLVKRLLEELSHVDDRCTKYNGTRAGSFNDTLIPRVVNIAKLVKGTNIYEDDDLAELCDNVIDNYSDVSCKELRESQDLRDDASSKARSITAQLNKLQTSKY